MKERGGGHLSTFRIGIYVEQKTADIQRFTAPVGIPLGCDKVFPQGKDVKYWVMLFRNGIFLTKASFVGSKVKVILVKKGGKALSL